MDPDAHNAVDRRESLMQPSFSPYPHVPFDPAPQATVRRHRRYTVAGTALVAGVAVAGIAYGVHGGTTTSGIGSSVALPSAGRPGAGGSGAGGSGAGGSGAGGSGATTTSIGSATAVQSVGVVDINTILGYEGARAAGTGIVLTPTGEILTNNHVINGATKISVTVVSTGRTYSAAVVGTDPTEDVAVIQLSGASGLQTARVGDSAAVQPGDPVTGVGNAGGAGGTPSAATGQVIAVNQSLTASDTSGANPERLTAMIEINAPIEAGDSGGPLYNSSGTIVGIDTAAQTNGRTTTVAYAIPIAKALGIASQIEAGQESSTIHIGLRGFLGVSVANTASGALIEGVVPGGPAAKAGVAAGDVITSANGTAVTSGTSLKSALSSHTAGDRIAIRWADRSGGTHSATVTLIAGPAD
jgi:S1-C subfamily serine protease